MNKTWLTRWRSLLQAWERSACRFWFGNFDGKSGWKMYRLDEILKLNLSKESRRLWTGLVWLRMGTTGGLF